VSRFFGLHRSGGAPDAAEFRAMERRMTPTPAPEPEFRTVRTGDGLRCGILGRAPHAAVDEDGRLFLAVCGELTGVPVRSLRDLLDAGDFGALGGLDGMFTFVFFDRRSRRLVLGPTASVPDPCTSPNAAAAWPSPRR